MLNLNCIICAELLTQSDEVYVTKCGHMFHFVCLMQWLERSKTCPQCRNSCKPNTIIRVYFNIANLDMSRLDAGSLLEELDNAKLQLKMKTTELEKINDQIKKLQDLNIKLEASISKFEKQATKDQMLLLNYSEQVKILKDQLKGMGNLQDKIKHLREHLETTKNLNTIINGSKLDAEKLLKTENNPKILTLWISALKRELRLCETKRNDARILLKVVQNDLRKEMETNKAQLLLIGELESENYILQQKLKNDLIKETGNLSVGLNTALIETPVGGENKVKTASNVMGSLKGVQIGEKELAPAPQKVEQSNSPYLNIKASCVGFAQLYNCAPNSEDNQTTTKLTKLRISPVKKTTGTIYKTNSKTLNLFKNQHLPLARETTRLPPDNASTSRAQTGNYVPNGYGGLLRVDPFLKPLMSEANNSKPNSIDSRLKSGRLRNIRIRKEK